MPLQKITPCLWFDGQAEEAVNFYTGIFRHSKILNVTHYGESSPRPAGSVMTILFELDGQEFLALNGGPEFRFTEAISLIVNCETQEEVDTLWEKLSAGGEEVECGWLKDKYGLSWQIVPTVVGEALRDPDPARTQRVVQAVWKMRKPDIATLQRAAEQG
jgi:predicted 3-demethylubiquinone-9 3-methyltransferase (glyoxalase superfamily)